MRRLLQVAAGKVRQGHWSWTLTVCLLTIALLPSSPVNEGFELWASPPGQVLATAEEAWELAQQGGFQRQSAPGMSRGAVSDDIWLLLRLPKDARWGLDPRLSVGIPLLDQVTLYRVSPGRPPEWQGQSGFTVPPAQRPLADRQASFRLAKDGHRDGSWLIRVHSSVSMATYVRLETLEDHAARTLFEQMATWCFVTVALLTCVAAVWAGRILRSPHGLDWSYLIICFVAYVLCWNGIPTTWWDWESPVVAHTTLMLCVVMAGVGMARVLELFMPSTAEAQGMVRWMRRYRLLCPVAALLPMVWGIAPSAGVAVWMVPVYLVAPFVVVYGWRGGNEHARLHGLVFLLECLTLMYQIAAQALGWFPVDGRDMYAWQLVAAAGLVGMLVNVIDETNQGRLRQIQEESSLKRALRQERRSLRTKVSARNAELVQANDALRREEQAHRRLLSMASHEFRTPAALIKASLDALRFLPPTLTAPLSPALTELETASQQLITLTNRVILIDQWHQLSHTAQLHPLDLREWLIEVAGDYAEDEALGLDLPPDDTPVWVMADPRLLGVALRTLLQQALGRCSRQANALVVSLHREASMVVIDVRDDGPSLSPADLADLNHVLAHERVDQLDSRHLGGSMVAAVLQRHGGQISAQSDAPLGLSMQMRLPTTRPETAA